jgi:hypothetical protein
MLVDIRRELRACAKRSGFSSQLSRDRRHLRVSSIARPCVRSFQPTAGVLAAEGERCAQLSQVAEQFDRPSRSRLPLAV